MNARLQHYENKEFVFISSRSISSSSKLGGWVKKSLQLVRTSINDENKIFATNNSNLVARLGDRCCDQLL